jgi:hypothetical protein
MRLILSSVRLRPGGQLSTCARWAGFLSIELNRFAFAIRRGDFDWVARFLNRFPRLRQAFDTQGTPFKQLAEQSGNARSGSCLNLMLLFSA